MTNTRTVGFGLTMLHFLSDENFTGGIINGLLHHWPSLDLVRVQDIGLMEEDDPAILEWAANHNLIVLTHDRATMPDFAYERIVAGRQMAGLFVFTNRISIGQAIDDLLLLDECSEQSEWLNQVVYLPL